MKKYISDEIRKNIGVIASAKTGNEIRQALEASLLAIVTIIEQDEIPLRKFASRMYFKGMITGLLGANIICYLLKIIGC